MSSTSTTPIPNHVIIGLGGTGGRIIRSLRRTIYEEFREKNPVAYERDENGQVIGKTEHPIKLAYVYVDSNPELMAPDDPTWKVPGSTLQLGESSQVLIGAGNLRGVLDNINSYPGIKPWIGQRDEWTAILDGQVSDAQGGQKRRLGRFLFASSNGSETPNSFNSRLQNQVNDLKAKGDARCVFHVVAGLAGGTGSGTVVDVVSQIRKLYPYPGTHLVVLYLMLPEANPDPAWARANYHANGYAALAELNAISVGAYQPYDISGTGERIKFDALAATPMSPFDGCYVFTNVNQNNRMVGVVDYQLHGVVSNFLFQKIIAVDDNEWAVGTLKKFEECENGDKQTGDNHPELTSEERGSPPQRSRRFLTFGIKRLIIPEEEIREYLCYSLARQMALQSLYNNWSDNSGYSQEPLNENIVELVRSAETRNRWRISDEHLILSSPILKHEESWKSLDQEWEMLDKIRVAEVEKEPDHRLWLSGLSTKCTEFYEKTFRGHGVERFFKAKEADAKDQAREICRLIDLDLFGEWREGKHSIHDIGRKLDETVKLLTEFRAQCDEKIVEFKRRAGDTEERSRLVNAIELNNREWFKVGPLSELFGKRRQLLDAQVLLYKKLYAAKTRAIAWEYAKKLSTLALEEIGRLRTSVANISSRLLQSVSGDTSRHSANKFHGFDELIAARCRPDEKEDLAGETIKVYEPRRVRDFSSRLVQDRSLQRQQSERFRQRITTNLDKRPGFFSWDQDYSLPKLFDILEAESDETVENCHNGLVSTDRSVQPTLGQNIVKGLQTRFPDPMELRSFIIKVMGESGLFLQFNESQVNMDGSGCIRGSLETNTTVIMPDAARAEPEFHGKVQSLFKEAKERVRFAVGSRPNVLTILNLANLFPLRYVSHVGFLKSRFDNRIGGPDPAKSSRARLELFTEGDGRQFPELFALSGSEVREKARPLVLLMQAMGAISRMAHHSSGQDLGWHFYDEHKPQDAPVALGMSDGEMHDNLDARFISKMQVLAKQRLSDPSSGAATKLKVQEFLDSRRSQILADYPNPSDPERQRQFASLEAAKSYLN